MENFSFNFFLMAVGSEFSSFPGLGSSSFPTGRQLFFKTAFPLREKAYCPGTDFDLTLFQVEKFPGSTFLAGFPSKCALTSSLGCLAVPPSMARCSHLHPNAPLVWHRPVPL